MARVELRGVGKVYPDGHRAVAGVDLEVDDGEFFVLLGPSGCGKTTVLRMVAGLEELSEGDIVVGGEPVGARPTNRRNLAMLFQSSALYPHMTVRANLGFPLRMAQWHHADIARRVGAVAEQLGLTAVLDEPPHRLSGGERQRVAMGRAIVREPSLLLMDEPMSNLDAKLRTELRGELTTLHRRLGVTTLYVTHDQLEAMSLGDRIAVLRDGVVVQLGRPEELYERPRDLFVARFLGSPPMNALLGTVRRDAHGAAVAVGSHVIPLAPGHRPGSLTDGSRVVVGIRPEALVPSEHGPVSVEITGMERLGAERQVSATIDAPAVRWNDGAPRVESPPSSTVVATLGTDVEVNPWKPVPFAIDPAGLHLFDPDDGAALR